MKLSELKEKIDNGEKIENLIEVKKYISIVDKKELIESIMDTCLKDADNGMKYVDYLKKQTSLDIAFVFNYSNIDELDVEDSYDFMIENGIIEYIVEKQMPYKEVEFINLVLDKMLAEQKELNNSISSIVNTHLGTVVDIINRRFPNEKEIQKIIKALMKSFNSLDWDKVPMLKKMRDVAEGKSAV